MTGVGGFGGVVCVGSDVIIQLGWGPFERAKMILSYIYFRKATVFLNCNLCASLSCFAVMISCYM